MPAFCQRCGELAEGDACPKCGEKAVSGPTNNKWKTPGAGASTPSVAAVPSAFTTAARIQAMGVQPVVVEKPRKEKATVLFNFIPQDTATQLRLTKGEEVEVVRKDPDGWWFVVKDGEKGLVPGSYVHIDKPFVAVPDAAILAAREASNQRFMEFSRSSAGSSERGSEDGPHVDSPNEPGAPPPVLPRARDNTARADARAGEGSAWEKPQNVRKLKKCFACKETILGRTKVAKDQIFHEICLLCKGCREPIEEDEDFILIKKKAYHAECGKDVAHCYVCDKEILGRVYKAGDASFHRLCMVCALCKKQAEESGSKFENDQLMCGPCVTEKERKEREEREAKERAAREKAEAEAAARALAEKKVREAEEAARAKAEAEAAAQAKKDAEAASRARAEAEAAAARAREAEEAAARAKAEAEAKANAKAYGYDSRLSDTSGLDEFDLEATPVDMASHERASEVSDFGSVLDSEYAYSNAGRDSMRLSEVLDMESIDAFNNGGNGRLSDISGLSIEAGAPKERPRRSTLQEDREDMLSDEEDRELCGGCGLVLEGEAVGALNQYFHYECFKCSHCRRVIAEDDGYAEKDNMAFHQACYQARYGKKCCRCSQVLKGKVVKALDNLYHPDCFVCFKCNSSLSESFFEHDGQAVCAKCKHEAIAYAEPVFPRTMVPVSTGVAGYRFDAQDETQLSIYPGDKVSILQKDDDGWWFVEVKSKRGYVPGSYLIEDPKEEPKPAAVPGLCSECGTQNPGVARFCRSCGNNLKE